MPTHHGEHFLPSYMKHTTMKLQSKQGWTDARTHTLDQNDSVHTLLNYAKKYSEVVPQWRYVQGL